MPKAILIFGPPGSGKGTQAELLERKLDAVHFDTGAWIDKVIHDPQSQSDPIIVEQKERYTKGLLADPEWVKNIVADEIKKIAKENKTIILSGSPRTLNEAEAIIPLLEELYGKDHIEVFVLQVRQSTSIFRNTHRRICEHCFTPLVWSEATKDLTKCPVCGGRLITRVDDVEDKIKVRLQQYQEETMPAIEFIRQRGFKVNEIDGEPTPEEVHKSIVAKLEVL
ncbi:MAG: adenylate kinase family protein [Candidatus Paceibacteria bacterium]